MKAWVTKYALTDGVFVVDGEVLSEGRMLSYRRHGMEQYAHGKDFYLTAAAAFQRFAEMRDAKIKSLRRQIERLEETNVMVPP